MSKKASIFAAQAQLSLPRYFTNTIIKTLLSFQDPFCFSHPQVTGPGGFYGNPANMTIAGFGNGAATDPIAA
jgi:hypothetical protein